MPLPLAAMGLAAIPSLAQGIAGAFQYAKGNRMNVVRPEYNIPNEVLEATANARQLAGANMFAGQQLAQNNISRSTANTVNAAQQAATSSSGLLAAITAANQNENQSMNQLAAQAGQFKIQNQQALNQQLGQQAQYQDKAWDWNKKQKFVEESDAKRALMGAGMQNIMGGLQGIGQIGGSAIGSGMLGDALSTWQQQRQAKQQQGMVANTSLSPMSQAFNLPTSGSVGTKPSFVGLGQFSLNPNNPLFGR
jgi:hypothetical protein